MGIIKSLRLGNRLNKRGFQTIEDLHKSIQDINKDLTNFDMSVFNGKYIN